MKNRTKILIRRVMRDRVRARTECTDRPVPLLEVEKWPKKWQDKLQKAHVIAAYMPMKDELSLEAFWQTPWLSHCRKCFPKVEGEHIVFYEITDEETMNPGSFGILEPDSSTVRIDPNDIDLILIPAAAYGRDGTRLGRGKGFYDRFVASMGEHADCALLGVVPDSGLLASVPADPWDLKVEAVVTQTKLWEVESKDNEVEK